MTKTQVRGYWPSLDGVRALAIALVLVVHAEERIPGGILGVDIFFVLSGFLISSLLLREAVDAGHIAIGNFYARRVLRLLPALLVSLALVAFIVALWEDADTNVVVAFPIALAYLANWAMFAGVYMGLLSPFWSLAIEEQFYLVWPWVIRRFAQSRRLPQSLVAVAAVMLFGRTGAALVHWERIESVPFFRADGLLLGAALAVVIRRGTATKVLALLRATIAPIAALAVIAASFLTVTFRSTPAVRSLAFGTVSIAAAVLIGSLVLSPDSIASQVFGLGALRAVGRVSYGLYLFNFPIFLWTQAQGWWMPITIIVEFGATTAITLGSWFLLEKRVLGLRVRFPAHIPTGTPVAS